MTDREDGLWIGSNGNGLAYLSPHWQNFTVLRHNVLDARLLPKGRPNAITACLDDTVFISNSDGDFLRIDANGQRHTDFSARWRKSLPNQEVWSLQCDEASVWIGHNRGLSRVDRKSGAIDHWHSEKTPYPKGALTLLVEQGDWLWSAVKGQALVRMNRRTGEIETIAAELGAPSTDYEQIRTMPSGELWVATAEGLF